MYQQKQITLKNALETFDNILKDMQADLDKYVNNPKYNEKVGFFKRMQIHNLQSVYTVFTEFLNDVNIEVAENQKEIGGLKGLSTRYEACCLYYGIAAAEIERFASMKTPEAVAHAKYAYTEGWRQMPLHKTTGKPWPAAVVKELKLIAKAA